MTTDQIIATISPTLDKYSMTAIQDGTTRVKVLDKKGQRSGYVSVDGKVVAEFVGRKTMMGSLVIRDIKDALESAPADLKTDAIAKIRDLMTTHGITVADLS